MSILDFDIKDCVDARNPGAWRIAGVDTLGDPRQALLYRARKGDIPSGQWKNRTIFYLPTLRRHMEARRAQLAAQFAGQAEDAGQK
jgi:hypothetical protein